MGAAEQQAPQATPAETAVVKGEDGVFRRSATILNSRGLHARAAAKFVKLAETFEADIQVSNGEMDVSGRSIMGLLMLAASPGKTVAMTATGEQAEAAMIALGKLIDDKFDED